jgi:hypothetical protein
MPISGVDCTGFGGNSQLLKRGKTFFVHDRKIKVDFFTYQEVKPENPVMNKFLKSCFLAIF